MPVHKINEAHTPGPWDFACDSYGRVQHSEKYDCVFTTLKSVRGDRLYTVAARIENAKDAVLIAAAPELLAALERLTQCVIQDESLQRASFAGTAMGQALAAIAKAKGKK